MNKALGYQRYLYFFGYVHIIFVTLVPNYIDPAYFWLYWYFRYCYFTWEKTTKVTGKQSKI